jgi:hypothetical protein
MTACKFHHAIPILITPLVVSVAANARAQDEEPDARAPVVAVQSTESTTPVASTKPKPRTGFTTPTGFAMDARLVHGIGQGGLAGDGLPPIAVGYRGERLALTVGPFYSSASAPMGMSSVGALGGIGSNGVGQLGPTAVGQAELSRYGGTLLAELVLFRTDDKRTAAHALVGATLAETKGTLSYPGYSADTSMPATYGLSVGGGLRHWLTPNFGVSVEGGESYVNSPSGIFTLRTRQLTTFGALGVSLVL